MLADVSVQGKKSCSGFFYGRTAKNCAGETYHARSGLFAHDDMGADVRSLTGITLPRSVVPSIVMLLPLPLFSTHSLNQDAHRY